MSASVVLAACWTSGCVSEQEPAPVETGIVEQEVEADEVSAARSDELPYEHSMQRAVPLADGRVPLVDTLDGPHGGRYAVVKEIHGADDDNSTGMTRSIGVVELDSRWMSPEDRKERAAKLGKPERPTDPVEYPSTLSTAFVEDLAQRQANEQLLVSIRLVKPQ